MIVCAKHCYLYVPSCSLLFCHECGPVVVFIFVSVSNVFVFSAVHCSAFFMSVGMRVCAQHCYCLVFNCVHFSIFNCSIAMFLVFIFSFSMLRIAIFNVA